MLARLSTALPRATTAGTRLASTAAQKRSLKSKRATEVKPEAKIRGIPTDKSSLVSSIEQGQSHAILKGKTPGARRASTVPTSPEPKIPGNPDLPVSPPNSFLDVKIPRPSDVAEPELLVQIPFVPDFWDSSTVFPEPEPENQPKMVVVGGADTHIGGGPSHNLLDLHESTEQSYAAEDKAPKVERSDTFLDDVSEDLGLPPVKEIKNSLWKLFS